MIEQLQKAELEASRLASYPPPYPEAWYVVARANDISDRPVQVRFAGNDAVLFRDRGGRVRAIGAYCPHMGAALADGKVKNGCIECPFHGWKMDGEGRVVHMSGGQTPEPRHRTTSWVVDELHGWVCVFHRHGELDASEAPEPPYRLQHLPEIDRGELRYCGAYDAGAVHMHLLEFAENSVDFQHFSPIHGNLRIPWTNIPVPGMHIEHEAGWRRDEHEPHVSWFENSAQLSFRGRMIPKSGADAMVRFDGPGSVVRFDFSLHAKPGRIIMYQSHTPIAPMTQHVRFQWFADSQISKLEAGFIVGNWVSQWRQDMRIWEKKIYLRRPMLSRGDGPVHQLRRWYSQFYPKPRSPATSDIHELEPRRAASR